MTHPAEAAAAQQASEVCDPAPHREGQVRATRDRIAGVPSDPARLEAQISGDLTASVVVGEAFEPIGEVLDELEDRAREQLTV